jgi:hypothetical protein
MKLSHQRLSDILEQLRQGRPASAVTQDEWLSIATELLQLRLRTSSESRSAASTSVGGAKSH